MVVGALGWWCVGVVVESEPNSQRDPESILASRKAQTHLATRRQGFHTVTRNFVPSTQVVTMCMDNHVDGSSLLHIVEATTTTWNNPTFATLGLIG
jgi:hypothetical protein